MAPRRTDLLAHWHSRGAIDRRSHRAGLRWRALCRTAHLNGAAIIDPERLRVDTSPAGATVAERRVEALQDLARLKTALGQVDFNFCYRLLYHEEDLAGSTEKRAEYIRQRVRDALPILADAFEGHVAPVDPVFEAEWPPRA